MSMYFNSPPPFQHAPTTDDDISGLISENEDGTEADTTIAEALKGLSLEEREQLYLDQHGVADVADFEDNPETVLQKLNELEDEIQKLLITEGVPSEAYRLADRQDPGFVRHTNFRLRFLYAELFDARKAASRLVRYFNYKQYLFGTHKLTKEIGLEDLSSEEMVYFKEGYLQLLPARDTAGRPILVSLLKQGRTIGPDSHGRLVAMFVGAIGHEIEKKGIVLVSFHLGPYKHMRPLQEAYIGARAISDSPMRFSAIHQCISDERFRLPVNLFMKMSDQTTRAKHKIHFGNHSECMNALMTYGMPHMLIPLADDGTIKRKNHLEWIRRKEAIVECRRSGISVDLVELPANEDVLLGKGRPIQEHRGNMTLQHIVDDLLPKYDRLETNKQKRQMCLDIVKDVKARNGRFLSQEIGAWTEVPDEAARDKVSNLFRNRRKQAKNKPAKAVKKLNGEPDSSAGGKRVRIG